MLQIMQENNHDIRSCKNSMYLIKLKEKQKNKKGECGGGKIKTDELEPAATGIEAYK